MKKTEEPKIHTETIGIYRIILWFEKIKNIIFLKKNRKKFIKQLIKNLQKQTIFTIRKNRNLKIC